MSFAFLLDTNVVSEPTRQRPEARVQVRLRAQPNQDLPISVITAGELRTGIELLHPGQRRSSLEQWFTSQLAGSSASRILPITGRSADLWECFAAKRQQAGSPLDMADGLIAATALEHNLVLVTGNTRHFVDMGVQLLNPWDLETRIV